MKVEKVLVDVFDINTTNKEYSLNDIILKAFPWEKDIIDISNRKYRVFFTSRKTLLNEFNHFEGNMNIFQPAIDITTTALQKEICDIYNKLTKIQQKYV